MRSAKRRKTISATMEQGVLVLRLPARLSRAQEQYWVERMRERFEKRKEPASGPETPLMRRAQALNRRHFEGKLKFSIDWVTNQKQRWGSCTPDSGRIRLSHELFKLPGFVVDYVIVHELAHLLEANHSASFWALVKAYPQADKAIGFLEGYHWARNLKGGDLQGLALEFGHLIEVDEIAVAVDG